MAFSPDGTLIAGASMSDGTVKLWNVASARLVRSLPTHAVDVYSVAFSPDGTTLAAATGNNNGNGTVVRWNTDTGILLGKPLDEPSRSTQSPIAITERCWRPAPPRARWT